MNSVKQIINDAFNRCFDWNICKPKEYKQKELERDIKQAIKEGIEMYIKTQKP